VHHPEGEWPANDRFGEPSYGAGVLALIPTFQTRVFEVELTAIAPAPPCRFAPLIIEQLPSHVATGARIAER
jgi:hypothetical protein